VVTDMKADGPESVTSATGLRVVPLSDWDAVVSRLNGFDSYLRLAYHRVSKELEPAGTRPVLLHHECEQGEAALPLLLRPLADGRGWDATSAYGYGGPVGSSPYPTRSFGEAVDAWARENAVVATFLRLHPLLDNGRLVPETAELVTLGPTAAWNVTAGRDLLAGLHPHHRRVIRKADRAGLQVEILEHPRRLDEFRQLYIDTMRRHNAASFYYFPSSYWDSLANATEELGLVLVEGRLGEDLAAALLCFQAGTWLHYHLGASTDAGRVSGASHRCFLAAAQWAQSRGLTLFHLGGGTGAGGESPLLTFKRRYDPGQPPTHFRVAKLVHDPVRYRELAGTNSTSGFFPPWRRPG
jgi:serine/alanine adding enzyme